MLSSGCLSLLHPPSGCPFSVPVQPGLTSSGSQTASVNADPLARSPSSLKPNLPRPLGPHALRPRPRPWYSVSTPSTLTPHSEHPRVSGHPPVSLHRTRPLLSLPLPAGPQTAHRRPAQERPVGLPRGLLPPFQQLGPPRCLLPHRPKATPQWRSYVLCSPTAGSCPGLLTTPPLRLPPLRRPPQAARCGFPTSHGSHCSACLHSDPATVSYPRVWGFALLMAIASSARALRTPSPICGGPGLLPLSVPIERASTLPGPPPPAW